MNIRQQWQRWRRAIAWAVAGVVMMLLVMIARRPAAIEVEVVPAREGPLLVTIAAEGKTRVHDRFIIAAPITGRLMRIEHHRGDRITAGEIIARIEPLPLDPLDPRQSASAEARLRAALATQAEIAAIIERDRGNLAQIQRDRLRAERLIESGDISRQEFEKIVTGEKSAEKQLAASRSRADIAAAEAEAARAALLPARTGTTRAESIDVRSPVNGPVLKLYEESERVVAAGTPLLEVSNPSNLELAIEALSSDAVRINPGARVIVERWGGDSPLHATVRTIEPSAFTRLSALGVEEQRVIVVADLVDRPPSLGDGYRVETRIVIYESDKALLVPLAALFHLGNDWALFVAANDGTARLRRLRIGQRSDLDAEVLEGLSPGERMILHPPNELSDGGRIKN